MSVGLRAGTPQELARSVQQLRERLSDVIVTHTKFEDDFYLIQWLKRQQFKVERTEAAIRDSIEWRREQNINGLELLDLHATHPGLSKDFPIDISVRTKDGQPVATLNGNGIDFSALLKKYGRENILRYFYHMYAIIDVLIIKQIENIKKQNYNQSLDFDREIKMTKDGGKQPPVVGFIVIATFRDFSLWNARSSEVIGTMFEAAKAGVRYFPCIASSVYLINTNRFLSMVFRLVKPIISSQAYTVDFYDTDRSKWSTVLTEDIDPGQLTPAFGGTKIVKI